MHTVCNTVTNTVTNGGNRKCFLSLSLFAFPHSNCKQFFYSKRFSRRRLTMKFTLRITVGLCESSCVRVPAVRRCPWKYNRKKLCPKKCSNCAPDRIRSADNSDDVTYCSWSVDCRQSGDRSAGYHLAGRRSVGCHSAGCWTNPAMANGYRTTKVAIQHDLSLLAVRRWSDR